MVAVEWAFLQRILNYLGLRYGRPRSAGRGSTLKVSVACPLAPWAHRGTGGVDRRPSGVVFFGPADETVYKCSACGYSGRLPTLLDAVAAYVAVNSPEKAAELVRLASEVETAGSPSLNARIADAAVGLDDWVFSPGAGPGVPISEDWLGGLPLALDVPAARDYLVAGRGVPEDLVARFGLRWEPRWDRVVFPVRDRSGRLVGATGRAVVEQPKKYYNYFHFPKKLSLFGAELVPGNPRCVLLVEGVFDAMRLFGPAECRGVGVVAGLSADLSDQQADMIAGWDASVVVVYDANEAGDLGAKIALQKLQKIVFGRAWRIRPPEGVDPDQMDEKAIERLFMEVCDE